MRRILVVDDQQCVRELVKQVLDLWEGGLEIHEAEDGGQALANLARCTYDLVVCDIDMPQINGIAVLEGLRKSEFNKDLPVIMLTGANQPDEIARAFKLGATSYVTKPFNVEDLMTALNASHDSAPPSMTLG